MSPFETIEENFPAMHGLAGPYPNTRGDSHYHIHQILYHENLELGSSVYVFLPRTRDGILALPTHVLGPRVHPRVEINVLIEQAGYDNQCWHRVQNGKYPYSYHKFF